MELSGDSPCLGKWESYLITVPYLSEGIQNIAPQRQEDSIYVSVIAICAGSHSMCDIAYSH